MDPSIMQHYQSMLLQTATVAQANFATVNQLSQLAYLQERNMVNLPEALGVREVASQSVPAGPKVNA